MTTCRGSAMYEALMGGLHVTHMRSMLHITTHAISTTTLWRSTLLIPTFYSWHSPQVFKGQKSGLFPGSLVLQDISQLPVHWNILIWKTLYECKSKQKSIINPFTYQSLIRMSLGRWHFIHTIISDNHFYIILKGIPEIIYFYLAMCQYASLKYKNFIFKHSLDSILIPEKISDNSLILNSWYFK